MRAVGVLKRLLQNKQFEALNPSWVWKFRWIYMSVSPLLLLFFGVLILFERVLHICFCVSVCMCVNICFYNLADGGVGTNQPRRADRENGFHPLNHLLQHINRDGALRIECPQPAFFQFLFVFFCTFCSAWLDTQQVFFGRRPELLSP